MSEEIRNAVDVLRNEQKIPFALKLIAEPLVSLAEQYLNCKGWPEKKNAYKEYTGCDVSKALGFNEAIDLCKLAAMKDKERLLERCSVEEIEDIMASFFGLQVKGLKECASTIHEMIKGEL